MRRPVIAGNWKMNKTTREAVSLVRELRNLVSTVRDVDIVVAPPATALYPVAKALEGSRIGLAAQDVHWEPEGAFTGNLSVPMLLDVGCSHVIVGHSERRQYHGETDEDVRKKVAAALDGGLVPIMCVGETLDVREAGGTMDLIRRQVTGGLDGLSADRITRVVVAYEPIWAIGTGRTASPGQAQEVHAYIRALLREGWGPDVAEATRILYGGSVKPQNVDSLMAMDDIDGALVGGASLDATSFARIVKFKRAGE